MNDVTFSILMTLAVCFGLSTTALFITPLLDTLEQAKKTYIAAVFIAALGVVIAFSHWLQSLI